MKSPTIDKEISIRLKKISLEGLLGVPENPRGIVIFSHGSGSSRFSARNNYVADQLRQHDFATLLFDLLTAEEDRVYENRFNIDLLTSRLVAVCKWIEDQPEISHLQPALFGASTGAASALKAAAKLGNKVKAVVSRGGRPDLADEELSKVQAPTLLIVGGDDTVVISLNQMAFDKLNCEKELKIVPGATHLFEEPGKLEEVAALASEWFSKHLQ